MLGQPDSILGVCEKCGGQITDATPDTFKVTARGLPALVPQCSSLTIGSLLHRECRQKMYNRKRSQENQGLSSLTDERSSTKRIVFDYKTSCFMPTNQGLQSDHCKLIFEKKRCLTAKRVSF